MTQFKDSQIVKSLKQWEFKSDTLHDHLCDVFNNITIDQVNGLAHFQRISEYFKKVKFRPKEPHSEEQIKSKAEEKVRYPEWLTKQQQTIDKIKKKQDKTTGKIIQNFQRQAELLFEPVGISFGSQQNYKINLTLKMLAQKQNAVNLRFWGKILTTSGDYLVIQGVCKKKKQPVITQGMQKYREGVNYYSFWVCQQVISEDWYELPLVTPQQIKTSRLIKHVFTGRLWQRVVSYPKFDGEQRHLLKCQLVRITHNCQIAPNGLYAKIQETPDEIQFAQQFKMPQFAQLTNLQGWVHINPYILGVGRADYYKDPKLTQQQRQQQLQKLQQSDPKIERLVAINADKPIQKLGMETCWIARPVGNLQIFNGKEQGTTSCYGAVTLKNPHWPGWLTVANSKSFGSIYIGYGYKLTQDCFYPISPQDIEVEGKQTDEFDEPNPRNPPDQLEPDSDEENKKPEDS